MNSTVLFRMNGVAPGFLREYGCRNCSQCSSEKPQAHISASLLIKNSWRQRRSLRYHILFDCGMGAIDSLIDFGAPPVDFVFISHGHPYHSLGLDRLVWGQVRHGGPQQISVYCTKETMETGPQRIYPWFFEGSKPKLVAESVEMRIPKCLDLGINLCITPVSAYQGLSAPGAVIWVVEFGHRDSETYHKFVLGWEFIHFIPRFPKEEEDSSYQGEMSGVEHLHEAYEELFKNVEELFFDGNTITSRPETHHMSIENALYFLIPEINPKRTWIVHYSGHEDPEGPLSDEQLQNWVDRTKLNQGMVDTDIHVAKHGMLLAYDV